jgi:hypothetical protein
MTLAQFHGSLGNSVILYLAICGIWGIVTFFMKRPASGSYLGALFIGELLIIAQTIVGLLLLVTGYFPDRSIHLLYGVLVAISLPAAYGWLRNHESKYDPLYLGLACLLIMGFSLRAVSTAHGG